MSVNDTDYIVLFTITVVPACTCFTSWLSRWESEDGVSIVSRICNGRLASRIESERMSRLIATEEEGPTSSARGCCHAVDALACEGASCWVIWVLDERVLAGKVAEPRPGSNLVGPTVSNCWVVSTSGFADMYDIIWVWLASLAGRATLWVSLSYGGTNKVWLCVVTYCSVIANWCVRVFLRFCCDRISTGS